MAWGWQRLYWDGTLPLGSQNMFHQIFWGLSLPPRPLSLQQGMPPHFSAPFSGFGWKATETQMQQRTHPDLEMFFPQCLKNKPLINLEHLPLGDISVRPRCGAAFPVQNEKCLQELSHLPLALRGVRDVAQGPRGKALGLSEMHPSCQVVSPPPPRVGGALLISSFPWERFS